MRYTGTPLMLLTAALFVVLTACGGREPQTVVVNPPAAAPEAAPVRETVREVVVPQPPPSPRQEVIPPAPSSAHVWVPGRWVWDNGWEWQSGHFEQPPERMAVWVPGQWVPQGSSWVWRPGRWQ